MEGETDEQFIYKTRKKAWGPFKDQTWNLPADTRQRMRDMLVDKLSFLYDELGVTDTVDLVREHIKPVRDDKPVPEALAAGVPS